MSDHVYPKDVLPEMEFVCPEPLVGNNCGNCKNTYVTNKGAVRPGLYCWQMNNLYESKNIKNGNASVTYLAKYSVCKFWRKK